MLIFLLAQEGGSEPVDDVMPQANSAVDGDGALPDADEGLGGSFLRKKRKKDKKKKKQVDSWEADVPSSPTKSPSTDPAAATEPLETEQPAPTDAVKEEDDDDFGGAANKKSKKNKKGAKKKAEKDKADKAKSTANGKKNKNVSFVDPSSAELKTKPEGAVADNNDTLDESPVPSQEAPNDDKSDAQEDIDTQNSPAEDPAPESQDAPEEAIQAAVEEASSEPSPDQVDTISTTNIIPIESSEENVSAEQSAQRPPNDSATPEDVPEVEAEQTMPDSSSVELPHSDAPDELPESSSEDASNNTNTELPQLPADDTQVLDTPDESPKDETTAPLAEECRAIDEIENSTTGTDSKAAEPLESSVDVTVDETSNAMEQPTDSTPSDIAPASNVANTDAISEVPTVESALPPTESKDETSRGEGDAGTQLDENISATVVKTPDLSVDAGGDESGDVEQQPIESTSSDTAATSEAAGIDASIETQTIEAASLPPTESETVLDDIGDEVVDSSLSQSQEAESLDSDDLEQPSQPAVEITESVTVEDSDLTPAEHLAAEEPIVAEETAHSEDAVQIEAAIESDQPVSVSGDHVEVSQSPLETSKPIEETDENGDVEEVSIRLAVKDTL